MSGDLLDTATARCAKTSRSGRSDGHNDDYEETATATQRDGSDYVLELDDGRELRGDRLLVATGRRPRVDGLGLETVSAFARPARTTRYPRHGNGQPRRQHPRQHPERPLRPIRPDFRSFWTLWTHRTDLTPALQG
jgi:hypothetical protein